MPRQPIDDDDYDELIEEDDDFVDDEEMDGPRDRVERRPAAPGPAPDSRAKLPRGIGKRISGLSDRITGGPVRPGEQELKRSPFVLILIATVAILALSALIVGYTIASESAKRRYDEAAVAMEQKKFGEAEKLWDKYLADYPQHPTSDSAEINRYKCQIQKHIASSTLSGVNIEEALATLDTFTTKGRDLSGFSEHYEDIRKFARKLAEAGAALAEKTRTQKPLDESRQAWAIYKRFPPEQGLDPVLEEDILAKQNTAEGAVDRQTVFDKAAEAIRAAIDSKDVMGALNERRALLQRHAYYSEDKELASLLKDTLVAERANVIREEEVSTAPLTEDTDVALPPPTTVALRTQAETTAVSEGRLVFTIGGDCCWGVDSNTGMPLWRKPLGPSSPFVPIPVEGQEPALLVFNTLRNELQLRRQEDGELIWRLPIGSRVNSMPLIHEQQAYITTDQSELLQVGLSTGKIAASLKFSQPVIGPPTLDSSETRLVIPGDASLIYTLSLRPLEALAVSFIEHAPGSVKTPIIPIGSLFILAENDRLESTRIQVLRLHAESGELSPAGFEDRIDGQVVDESLLRGSELFIPSSPQRITAYRVTDDPDQIPMSKIGAAQLQDVPEGRMYLLAGPRGQMWMASRSFRKYQVKTDGVELLPESTASGVHVQPIRFFEDAAYLTRQLEYTISTFLSETDRQTMKGVWRTAVGTHFVALGRSGEGTLLAIADDGAVFRIPTADIGNRQFIIESNGGFNPPQGLDEIPGGVMLADGRAAAWSSIKAPGKKSSAWTFITGGQLEQSWDLDFPPEANGVPLAGGLLLPTKGGLELTAIRGVNVEDYRAPQEVGADVSWKHLVALSETEAIAFDTQNRMIRVQYRDNPRPSLAEVSVLELKDTVDTMPFAGNGRVLMPYRSGALEILDQQSLEPLDEIALNGPPSGGLFSHGDRVFVEVGRSELRCFDVSGAAKLLNSVPLDSQFIVDQPLAIDGVGYLVGLSNGSLLLLDENGAATDVRIEVGQRLQSGPMAVDDAIVIVTVDGSLYRVESLIQ